MKFTETTLQGAYLIEPQLIEDSRGFFTRTYCEQEFRDHGLVDKFPQSNMSYNYSKATLRGMHYQNAPHREVKVVQCTMGAIWDAIVDLRPESPTYCQAEGFYLYADKGTMLYVPEGFAHGYLTLANNSRVFYQVSYPYTKNAERGVMWNDPAFDIKWPGYPSIISERDIAHPPYEKVTNE